MPRDLVIEILNQYLEVHRYMSRDKRRCDLIFCVKGAAHPQMSDFKRAYLVWPKLCGGLFLMKNQSTHTISINLPRPCLIY